MEGSDLQRAEEGPRLRQSAFDVARDHAAEAAHLSLGQLVLRVRLQTYENNFTIS